MKRVLKFAGLGLLYLSCVLVTVILYYKLKLYYSESQMDTRASIARMNNADIDAEIEQALADGEYGFIGYTTGWGTAMDGVHCPGIEYEDIKWRRYVGHGDVVYSQAYNSAASAYASNYNIALVTHPDSPHKGLCGLKEMRCDWDESEGGLRGCETIELPVLVSDTRKFSQ
jgi:hypothetical protein